jgi:hypothetical protein
VLPEVRLAPHLWRLAAAALAVALALAAATAPGANAAHRGFGASRARPQPPPSCVTIPPSGLAVIPHQTLGSVRRGGFEVNVHAAHSARWILIVTAEFGHSPLNSPAPIGSATKLLPKPGRARIRVPLDLASLQRPKLHRLTITLIWTEAEGSGKCEVFNAGERLVPLRG